MLFTHSPIHDLLCLYNKYKHYFFTAKKKEQLPQSIQKFIKMKDSKNNLRGTYIFEKPKI